jgi:uncharacterized protein YacL
MFDVLQPYSRRLERLLIFTVLGATFYASLKLCSVELGRNLFLHISAYATVLLVFISYSERVIANFYKSISEISRLILANAIGILIGTCIMLLLKKSLSNHSDSNPAIIISSVIVFFVLGTLCPLVHTPPQPHTINKFNKDKSHTP